MFQIYKKRGFCRVVDSYLLNTLYLALSHDRESVQRIITLVNESDTKKRIVFSKECVELVKRICYNGGVGYCI